MNPYILAFAVIFLCIFAFLFFSPATFLYWPQWVRLVLMVSTAGTLFGLLAMARKYRG